MNRALGILTALGLAAAILAGCTGVPSSSTPQVVVNQVGPGAQSSAQSFPPTPGADARTIVLEFLEAVASSDPNTAARAFLTPTARISWSDSTISILDAPPQVSNVVNGVVTVSGRELGKVNATSGVYSPILQGDGTGQATEFSYTLVRAGGQFRISALPSGIVLPAAIFEQLYLQHEVYFYNLAEQALVPDLRYSSLEGSQLATWLVEQLVAGPSAQLESATATAIPPTTDPGAVTIAVGSPSVLTLPGAAQLDPTTRNLLAQQVAFTLNQVVTIGEITIVDGGRPVSVPAVGGTRFAASDFANPTTVTPPAPALYYIRNGALVDQTGRPVPGAIGNGSSGLTAAGVSAIAGIAGLLVAGVSGPLGHSRLLMGTTQSGLRSTGVAGALTRPAWAPGLSEVWIGDGPSLLRRTVQGVTSTVSLQFAEPPPTASITAVRFSPDGERIAIVFTGPDGVGHLWIGSVVRSQSHVQVIDLNQITPVGVSIVDVAWTDTVTLFVIGRTGSGTAATGEANVYEVRVDGSRWNPRGIANLPQDPDSITVAEDQVVWVSAGHTVWEQPEGSGSAWASPGIGPTPGTNPVYEE